MRCSRTWNKTLLGGLLSLLLGLLLRAGVAQAQPFAYVTNANDTTVSVVDTATNTVTTTVGVGNSPQGVAVTPDGQFVYVANLSSNTVSVVDTATNTVTTTVGVGNSPRFVAVTPDGQFVYVTNAGSTTVSVVDTVTNTVTTTVGVGNNPQGVAITPDGQFVYVANANSASVSVIATATNTMTTTVGVGNVPVGVAVTPDGQFVYVANRNSGTVSVIATATNTVTRTVPVGFLPEGVAVTPDGQFVYVANFGDNMVSVIATATNTVTTTVPVGSNPRGVAITPDGQFAYVANSSSATVSVIATATNTVTTTVPVGSGPTAFGQFIGPVLGNGTPTFNVDRFDDNATATACNNATLNDCSLRGAIIAANALAGADTITLPAGTYTLTAFGPSEEAAATGDLDINSDITINGAGAASTVVDGGALDRVFHIHSGVTVTITGLTIQNGSAGGIENRGKLTLNGSTVRGNSNGGGIQSFWGFSGPFPELTLNGSTVSHNSSSFGGGIDHKSGPLTIADSNINFNTGGGILFSSDTSTGTLTITDSTLSGNTQPEEGFVGGGLFVAGPSTATIKRSTISGNSADGGGGLFTDGNTTLTNVTVSGNHAGAHGGGGIRKDAGTMTVTNSTVAFNTTSATASFRQGGIQAFGNTTLKNVIVAHNTANSAVRNCSANPITSAGHNLSSDGSCTFSASGDLNNTDPRLGPLAANGGLTQTHALCTAAGVPDASCAGASPAIDAGDNTGCPSTDQRGFLRPQGAACDIGAYEMTECTPSPEVCNNVDDDCNGEVDDNPTDVGQVCDTQQPGVCSAGTTVCTSGTLSCQQDQQSSAEVCDGVDNDCNGQTDEFLTQSCYTGPAGTEGVGVCQAGTQTCSSGSFGACSGEVTPSVAEVCDGLDNDCNGQTDEGNPGGGAACTTGQPGVCSAGTQTCAGGALVCQQTTQPSAEVCGNTIDEDCNGQVAVCNTPSGDNVATQPEDTTTGTTPVTLTFSTVNQGGDTNLTTSTSGPTVPSGFQVGNPATYYEITTTAIFSGAIEVCIDYTGVSFNNEAELNLFHFEGGQWVNATTSLDTVSNIICASVPSLSPFAIFERTGAQQDVCTPTTVLDTFNRANGSVGPNWRGVTGTSFYRIAGNRLDVQAGGPLYWNPAAFGTSQAAFVTLSMVDSKSPSQGILLKVQSGTVPNAGAISVVYDAAAKAVRVSTVRLGALSWTPYGNTSVLFANGDKLGACAKANGEVRVYKNDALIKTVTLTTADQGFFNAKGGKIGVWSVLAPQVFFDDFGSATIAP